MSQSLSWSKENTKKLIEMFKASPELWDTTAQVYKDREKKNAAITAMAEYFKVPTAEISRKLHNIRTQMNNEIRRIKNKKSEDGGDNVFHTPKWEFFDSLKFMICGMSYKRSEVSLLSTCDIMGLSKKSKKALYMKERRRNERPEERRKRIDAIKKRNARSLENETEEERRIRLDKAKSRMSEYRARESLAQKRRRLEWQKDRYRKMRDTESPKSREIRLAKMREYVTCIRSNESSESREVRLLNMRKNSSLVTSNKSPNSRKHRLLNMKEYATHSRSNELPNSSSKSLTLLNQFKLELLYGNEDESSLQEEHNNGGQIDSIVNTKKELTTTPKDTKDSSQAISTESVPHSITKLERKRKMLSMIDELLNTAIDEISKRNDDEQIFGDFVSSSLRNLRSETSKRKLKRKIQVAILEISDYDEENVNLGGGYS